MGDLNSYLILTGVVLIYGTLFWAGFTGLWGRLRRSKLGGKKRRKRGVSSRP